jgi:hypothetical protein
MGLLMAAVATYILVARPFSSALLPVSSAILAQPVGDLPVMADKPEPQGLVFDGCPPEGRGGDAQLNLLNNRVDKGDYAPVSFDSITSLTWPKSVEMQAMKEWSPDSRAFIERYLGIPVLVEGYILNVREGEPGPPNCGQTGGGLDWIMYFTKNPRDYRSQAIMAVSTAPTRRGHTWTLELMRGLLSGQHLPVRISGWLYFDPDHPQEVGKTRATLWEIRPVMQIDVFQDGHWNPLDRYGK